MDLIQQTDLIIVTLGSNGQVQWLSPDFVKPGDRNSQDGYDDKLFGNQRFYWYHRVSAGKN